MTLQHAIASAIKGGWKELHGEITIQKNGTNEKIYHVDWAWGVTATGLPRGLPITQVLLDPAFWRAFIKSRGCICGTHGALHTDQCPCSKHEKSWQYLWHRLIDHLAENKSVESFFETL